MSVLNSLKVPVLTLLIVFLNAGCSEAEESQWDMPVNDLNQIVESLSRDIGWRGPIGSVSCCWKAPGGKSAEWQAMPELILIKWFSFAEQQSYRAVIKLENPDKLLERMQQPAPAMFNGKKVNMPRHVLALGLAPGGKVVMWIMNWEETAIEVGRYQAARYDNKESDYTQWVEEYLEEEGGYIRAHSMQYDRW
ncbi:DUF2931 family protein [uncultured Marinobacter sp.]|uniref:DUF2931 family protein n=1 Tax=uncultured Marinobacter sp. TaxID=187379 RepID=UPI0030D91BF2|tara:strand:- start:127 stop:705 length:579 start_codon:yes stop_codon:yes gene_type:complete